GGSHAHFLVTSSGVMAYRTGGAAAAASFQLTWLDREGGSTQKGGDPANIDSSLLSPDETPLGIFLVENARSLKGDFWLLDIARNVETRLTTGASVQQLNIVPLPPVWSPDGKQLAYASGNRIYVKDTGGATEARLVKDLGRGAAVTDWTRGGRGPMLPDARAGAGCAFWVHAHG